MLFFHGVLTVFLVAIFFYDLTRYIIPNWIVGIIIALWPAMLLLSNALPEGFVFWHSILVMLLVFAVGIFVFAMRWAGGGDVKLLAVLALWTGTQVTLELVVYMGVLGGLLVLLCLFVRPLVARFVAVEKAASLPRVLRDNEAVPYGVAITISFLYLLWSGQVPGLPLV